MSHVEPSRLFALVRGELGHAEAEEVRAHVAACEACGKAVQEVLAAQPLFSEPPVPELDAARWRAIDEKVMAAAAREMQRELGLADLLRSFLNAAWFKPALALGAAAAVIAIVFALTRSPTPRENLVATIPEPAGPGEATVIKTALDSSSDDGNALVSDSKLKAGTTIATRKGETWLNLNDKARLGVLAASRARLDQLTPLAVKVSLEEGGLAVTADYAPQQQLQIVAGRLTVRAVGSKFLVMRDAQSTGIAVEEGTVDVDYDGKHQTLGAGRSLSLSNTGVENTKLDEADQQHMREMIAPPVAVRRRPAPQRVAMIVVPDASVAPAGPEARLEDGDEADDVPAPAPAPVVNAKVSDETHELEIAPAPADGGSVQASTNPCKKLTGFKRAGCEWDRARCGENERSIKRAEAKWFTSIDGGLSPKYEQKWNALMERRARCQEKLPH